MTTQERINQLAEAALRAAPSSGGIPKPKTFMPSFEKLRSAEYATPGELSDVLPVTPATTEPAGCGPAPAAAVRAMPIFEALPREFRATPP